MVTQLQLTLILLSSLHFFTLTVVGVGFLNYADI